MKSKIYLLAILILFLAFKGEKQKNTTAEPLGTVEQSNEVFQETTDTTNVNIKDIFLLLPENVFPKVPITLAQRKELLECIGEEGASEIYTFPIKVCDVKNGYLSLTGMQFGWEMCYWNLNDGRKLVAVNNNTESGSEIRIFFYQNGKLSEDHNYQLGGNQNYKLTDFIDVPQLSSNIRKLAEEQFAKGDYSIYYQLPQEGTSLILSVDDRQLLDYHETYEIPYEATKYLILKWKNEKWVR